MLRRMFLAMTVLAAASVGSVCSGDLIPTADLAAWLDADAITGVANGGAVGTWANSASTGATYDATQGTAANQPLWYSNVVNGHAAVRFDGLNDMLKMSSNPMVYSHYTVFAVVRRTGADGGVIVGNIDAVGGAVTGMALTAQGTGNAELSLNANSLQVANGDGGGC